MSEWVLDWPPVTSNNLYRTIPGHGRVMVPEARAWKDTAILTVRLSGSLLPVGSLSLTLDLYPPKGFRGDTSNCIKLVEDAVFAAYGVTDHRVAELHVYRHERGPDPRIVARVERCAE